MNIKLPKDAEGREIPLDTTVLYDKDGNETEVSRYQYYPKVGPGYWNLRSVRNKYYRQDEVYLTPPDSWKKLLEDLDRGADADFAFPCAYFDKSGSDCESCIINKHTDWRTSCDRVAMSEIASRIRKLRGED